MGSAKGTICHIQIKGKGKSRSEEISIFPFVIGRGDDADVHVLASGISRAHISVTLRDGALWIEDLGSANGTFVNEKKLNEKTPTPYKEGDSIRLGLNNDTLTMELHHKGKPEEMSAGFAPLPPLPPLPVHVEAMTSEKKPEPVFQKPPLPMAQEPFEKPFEGAPDALAEASMAATAEHLAGAKALALRIKADAESEAANVLRLASETARESVTKARGEASGIVAKAKDEAYQLQQQAELESAKIREGMQWTISKMKSEAENKAEGTIKEASSKASAVKAAAQTEAEEILSQANQKTLDQRNKCEADLKILQSEEKKKGAQILEKAQGEADKILEVAQEAAQKIRGSMDKEIDTIKGRVEKEGKKSAEEVIKTAKVEAEKIKDDATKIAQKINDDALKNEKIKSISAEDVLKVAKLEADKIKAEATKVAQKINDEALKNEKAKNIKAEEIVKVATSEAEKIKTEAAKIAQKISDEVLKSERTKNISTFDKENKGLADMILTSQISLRNLEQEKKQLQDKIEHLKASELKMSKDFEETKAQTLKEQTDLKTQIEKEKTEMRNRLTEEEKNQREDAERSFYLQLSALEKKVEKARIKEISHALEICIMPRIKESLNWEEIPKPLQNFSSDIRDIVTKVINGDFSEMVANTAMDAHHVQKKSFMRSKAPLFFIMGLALVFVLIPFSQQNVLSIMRRPSSEAQPKSKGQTVFVLTNVYKNSYTDNILYTKGYADLKLNPNNQEAWRAEVVNFLTTNRALKKANADRFVGIESHLVHNLAGLASEMTPENRKESIQRMTVLEKLSLDQFLEALEGQENYSKFREFEKNYFEKKTTR